MAYALDNLLTCRVVTSSHSVYVLCREFRLICRERLYSIAAMVLDRLSSASL